MSWREGRGYNNQTDFSVSYSMHGPNTTRRFETDRHWNEYEHVETPWSNHPRYSSSLSNSRLPYFLDYGSGSQPRFYQDQHCLVQVPRFRGSINHGSANRVENIRNNRPTSHLQARFSSSTNSSKALQSVKSNSATNRDNALMKKAGQIIDDILSGGTGKDVLYSSPVQSSHNSIQSSSSDVGATLLAQADNLRKQFGEKRAQLFQPRENNETLSTGSLLPSLSVCTTKLSTSLQQRVATAAAYTAQRRKSTADSSTALSSGVFKAGMPKSSSNLAHLLNSRSRKDKIAVAKLLDTYKQKLPIRPKLATARTLMCEEELLDIDLSDIPDDVKFEISELLEDAGLWSVLNSHTSAGSGQCVVATSGLDSVLQYTQSSAASLLHTLDVEPDSLVVSRALLKLNDACALSVDSKSTALHSVALAQSTATSRSETATTSRNYQTDSTTTSLVYANAESKPIVFTLNSHMPNKLTDTTGDSVLLHYSSTAPNTADMADTEQVYSAATSLQDSPLSPPISGQNKAHTPPLIYRQDTTASRRDDRDYLQDTTASRRDDRGYLQDTTAPYQDGSDSSKGHSQTIVISPLPADTQHMVKRLKVEQRDDDLDVHTPPVPCSDVTAPVQGLSTGVTAACLMQQLLAVTVEEEAVHNKLRDTQLAVSALQQLLQDAQQQLTKRQLLHAQLQSKGEDLRKTRIDLIRRLSAAGSDVTIASEMPDRASDYDCVVVMETNAHEAEVTSTTMGEQWVTGDAGVLSGRSSVARSSVSSDATLPAAADDTALAMDYSTVLDCEQPTDSAAFDSKLLQNLASRFAKLRGQPHLFEGSHLSEGLSSEGDPRDMSQPADLGNLVGVQPGGSDRIKVKASKSSTPTAGCAPKKLKSRRQRDEESVLAQSRCTVTDVLNDSGLSKKTRVKKDSGVSKVIRTYFDAETSSDVSLTQDVHAAVGDKLSTPTTNAATGHYHTSLHCKPTTCTASAAQHVSTAIVVSLLSSDSDSANVTCS